MKKKSRKSKKAQEAVSYTHLDVYKRQVLVRTKKIEYNFTSIDSVISTVFQSMMFVVGGISIIDGNMTIGQFTMVNTYFGMFLKVVKYYINFFKDLQDTKASYTRILNLKTH